MKTEMEAMSRWDFQNEIKRNRISYLKNLHETGPNIIQLRNSRAERSYPASEATGCSHHLQWFWSPSKILELPHVRGQGQWPRVPGCHSAGTAERSASKVRGCGQEEPLHAQGQGRQPGGATPRPRSSGCVGTGGPRGTIPRWMSGRVALRTCFSSKVRSSSCTLLEQAWRDTPHPR